MKKLLLLACSVLLCYASNAQYLLGFSPQGFKKKSLVTNQDTIIVQGLGFYEYQANTTSDLDHRYFCMIKSWGTNNEPDTLMTIDIATATVTKDTISRGTLLCPEFHNEVMYGVGPAGFGKYDLATHQYTLLDPDITSNAVEQASYNHTTNDYLYLSKGPNSSGFYDTICRYNVTTGILIKDTIPSVNNCFDYTPGSDKAFTIGIQNNTALQGIFVYDFATGTKTFGAPIGNTGIMSSVSTIDPVNNKYYCIKIGNGMSKDTIGCFAANTNTFTKTDIIKNSLANIEFFATVPPTQTASVSSPGTKEAFMIYPNPAIDKILINMPFTKADVMISDITGKQLLQSTITTNENELSIKDMLPGIYLITIQNGGISYSKNFVKQ